MRKIISLGGSINAGSARLLNIRAGLELSLDPVTLVYPAIGGNAIRMASRASVSPDKTKFVSTNYGTGSENMLYEVISDNKDVPLSGPTAHAVTFGGAVYTCSTSNEFMAYGGTGPKMGRR